MPAGGFALAIVAPIGVIGASATDPPAYLAQCHGGEEPDSFTTTCVPLMTPNPQASEAERMAAEAEQIGQDVAEADNTWDGRLR